MAGSPCMLMTCLAKKVGFAAGSMTRVSRLDARFACFVDSNTLWLGCRSFDPESR